MHLLKYNRPENTCHGIVEDLQLPRYQKFNDGLWPPVTETQQMFALIPGMKLGGGKVEANVKGF